MQFNLFRKVFGGGSEFKKNVLTLTGGMAIAQAIPVLCSPILSRLFSPEEFGVFANFVAIAAFVNVVIAGKYELAIILPERDHESINVLALGCFLALISSIILCFIFLAFGGEITHWLNVGTLSVFYWLIPISALLSTIYLIFNEWCIRKKWFAVLGKNKISNTAGISGVSIVFGLLKNGAGLIWGQILGQVISSSLAICRVLKSDKHLFAYVSINKMKYFAKKYSNFAKYIIPGQLMNTVAGQMPVFLLSSHFGIYEVGLFALTDRVLGTPLTFLGNAFKDVFKQRAAQDYKIKGNCIDIYKKTSLTLLGIVIIPFALLFIIAPTLFAFVFGDEWYTAGEYVRYLSVMYMISFVSMPTSWMFVIAEKQKLDMVWQILFLFFTVAALVIGIVLGSVKATLISFCIGRSVVYFIQIYFTYKIAAGRI